MPADTPNDGLPDTWHPVAPPTPVAPPMIGAPQSDKYFATSIPLPMQLEPDIVGALYPGGLASYRIMPPILSGNPDVNSAIKSFKG